MNSRLYRFKQLSMRCFNYYENITILQFNFIRQSTQLEELETLKASIQCQQSSRSRNLSNERPITYQRQLQFSIDYPRHSNKAQSFSVEKQLNLSSQSQKVENLIATWMHQKNSSSLNSSSNVIVPCKLINDIRSAQQLDIQNKESNKPHIIIGKRRCLVYRRNRTFCLKQQNQVNQNSYPSYCSSQEQQRIIQEIKKNNKGKIQNNNNYQKPQSTKINTGNYAKSSPLVFKEQNPIKTSLIYQTKLINSGTNNQNNKNKQYSSKIFKKNSISTHEENQQEYQFIPELVKLKEQILSTYLKQNRALIGFQNQIIKNFDEILSILKQDFPK